MAKQPAKKKKRKTAPRKKKAVKRGAPTKTCPKCSKTMHAATLACECGYKFPGRKKKKKKRVKTAARSARAVSPGEGALSQKLAESIKIVERAGGLEEAKQMLGAVKELEKHK